MPNAKLQRLEVIVKAAKVTVGKKDSIEIGKVCANSRGCHFNKKNSCTDLVGNHNLSVNCQVNDHKIN